MTDRRDEVLHTAIKAVRLYGLEGMRIQHIGQLAGMASSSVYTYFKCKDDLLRACFELVDRQIAGIFDRVKPPPEQVAEDPAGAVRLLWIPYFRWLVDHPDETVFYHRFRDASFFPAFDRQRDVSYFASFIRTVAVFQSTQPGLAALTPDLLWLHILTTTVLYAKYVAEGVLPSTPETEERVFRLLFSGLAGYLAPAAETENNR